MEKLRSQTTGRRGRQKEGFEIALETRCCRDAAARTRAQGHMDTERESQL